MVGRFTDCSVSEADPYRLVVINYPCTNYIRIHISYHSLSGRHDFCVEGPARRCQRPPQVWAVAGRASYATGLGRPDPADSQFGQNPVNLSERPGWRVNTARGSHRPSRDECWHVRRKAKGAVIALVLE